MGWKEFSISKVIVNLVVLIIGLILKFPAKLESLPLQYEILGVRFTQSQYSIISIAAYILIVLSVIYLVILVVGKIKRK